MWYGIFAIAGVVVGGLAALVGGAVGRHRGRGLPSEREIQRRIESWREITGRDLTHEVAKQRREMGL